MTEEELQILNGNDWNNWSADSKFHAVSNLMYFFSENEGWAYELSEDQFVSLIDHAYEDNENLDKPLWGIFMIAQIVAENQ